MQRKKLITSACVSLVAFGGIFIVLGFTRQLPTIAAPMYCSMEGAVRDAVGPQELNGNGTANCLRGFKLCCG